MILKVGLTHSWEYTLYQDCALTSVRAKCLRNLHELTISTKNRVSKSVCCTTSMRWIKFEGCNTFQWVMSRMKESCLIRMINIHYKYVLSQILELLRQIEILNIGMKLKIDGTKTATIICILKVKLIVVVSICSIIDYIQIINQIMFWLIFKKTVTIGEPGVKSFCFQVLQTNEVLFWIRYNVLKISSKCEALAHRLEDCGSVTEPPIPLTSMSATRMHGWILNSQLFWQLSAGKLLRWYFGCTFPSVLAEIHEIQKHVGFRCCGKLKIQTILEQVA